MDKSVSFPKWQVTSGPSRVLTFCSASPPEVLNHEDLHPVSIFYWPAQMSLLSIRKTCSLLKLYCIMVASKFLVPSLGIQSNKEICQ